MAGISSPREELKRDNILLSIVHVMYPEVVLLREPGLAPMIGATCLGSCWSYYWSVLPWLFLNISPSLIMSFLEWHQYPTIDGSSPKPKLLRCLISTSQGFLLQILFVTVSLLPSLMYWTEQVFNKYLND